MTPDIQNEHALETYRSLINISVAGFKLLALLNGGAVVALLTFLGNVSGKGLLVPNMSWPMGFFLGGLSLCGLAFFFSYWTQFILYQEIMGGMQRQIKNVHIKWHRYALICALLSLILFIIGSYLAIKKFQSSYTSIKTPKAITYYVSNKLTAES